MESWKKQDSIKFDQNVYLLVERYFDMILNFMLLHTWTWTVISCEQWFLIDFLSDYSSECFTSGFNNKLWQVIIVLIGDLIPCVGLLHVQVESQYYINVFCLVTCYGKTRSCNRPTIISCNIFLSHVTVLWYSGPATLPHVKCYHLVLYTFRPSHLHSK